jgi:hypothetical protein
MRVCVFKKINEMKGYTYFTCDLKLYVLNLQCDRVYIYSEKKDNHHKVSELPTDPKYALYEVCSFTVKKIMEYKEPINLKRGVCLNSVFGWIVGEKYQQYEFPIYITKKALKEKIKVEYRYSPGCFELALGRISYKYFDELGRLHHIDTCKGKILKQTTQVYNNCIIYYNYKKNTTIVTTNGSRILYSGIVVFSYKNDKLHLDIISWCSYYYRGIIRSSKKLCEEDGSIWIKRSYSKSNKIHGIIYNKKCRFRVYNQDKFISYNLQKWYQHINKPIRVF